MWLVPCADAQANRQLNAGGVNTWTGGTGNWNDPSGWSMNRVPGECENVIIIATSVSDVITVSPGAMIDILNLSDLKGRVELGNGSTVHMHVLDGNRN